ncbi:hypothetical protein SAMN04515660_2725 [Luteibacter sp. 329MFSha]|nr:hypothetical protein SAMN04515660_2725 [Luteibacter sp. 329MFSha]
MLALQAVVIYVRVHKSSLFSDDFLNFAIFDESGLTISYLLRDVFGQVAPGYRLVQGIVFRLFGPSFIATATIIAALSMTCSALLAGIARRLGASNPAIAAGLLIFIGLPQFTQTQQWWAAAVHTIFSLTAILAASYCLAGSHRHRIALGTFWFGIALGFTAKVVCSPVILAAIAFYREWRVVREFVPALREALRAIVPVAALTALYMVGLAVFGPQLGNAHPSASLLATYVWTNLVKATIGASFGLDAWGFDLPGWVSALGMILFAGWSIQKDRGLALLWGATLIYVLASAAIIGWNRAGTFPDAGATLRYGVEGATFLVLGLMLGISSLQLGRAAIFVTLLIATLVLINTQAHLRNRVLIAYPIDETRSYIRHLKASLRQLKGRRDVVILQGTVPESIMPAWMAPFGDVSRLLHLYSPLPVADRAKATHELMRDGSIRPITAGQAPL